MPITIQEIIASDTISQLVDKTNFNFDQLLLNGGGPAGPIGPQGPQGPGGGRGPKGSTWYEDVSPAALPPVGVPPSATVPTTTPRNGDFYLQLNGDVWEYIVVGISGSWVITTINLIGPVGPQGPPGGFGLSFGAFPVIGNQNTLYNGQLGTLTTGANITNEGVPSIMMGGMASNYSNPIPGTSPALTDAYIIPWDIEQGLTSDVASVMIHQKVASGKSIVFHGGNSDYFDQNSIDNLSNISIGVDDKLILDIPKATAIPGPLAMSELVGFQVDSLLRSQSYNAGQQIRFVTGIDGSSYFAGENSNFEISVGAGSTTSSNKFKVETLSSGAATTMEMGGNVTLLSNQTTNSGKYQLLAGNARFITTTNAGGSGEFSARAQGNISLNTFSVGGGNIALSSGTSGITATSAGGTISIAQTETSTVGNIEIDQQSTVGDLLLRANSNIALSKRTTASLLSDPSITLDYTAVTGGSTPNYHTRIVGKQTWAPTEIAGSITQPFSNVMQSNDVKATMLSGTTFRQVGTASNTSYQPSSALERWIGGVSSGSQVDAGLISIIVGNESQTEPTPADEFMYDNSLELSVRNSSDNEEYISLSKSKLGLATPLVLKRARELNSTQNNAPSYVASSTGTPAPYNWGWDTRQGTAPSTPANDVSQGLPTTNDLNVPIIFLNYGPEIGLKPAGTNTQNQNTNYDYHLNFPTGAYPGQRLTVIIKNQAVYWTEAGKSLPGGWPVANVTRRYYGSVMLHIPTMRNRIPSSGLYSSWWSVFTPIAVVTDYADSSVGRGKSLVLELIWDGTESTQTGADLGASGTNDITTELQLGWHIISNNLSYMTQGYVSGI